MRVAKVPERRSEERRLPRRGRATVARQSRPWLSSVAAAPRHFASVARAMPWLCRRVTAHREIIFDWWSDRESNFAVVSRAPDSSPSERIEIAIPNHGAVCAARHVHPPPPPLFRRSRQSGILLQRFGLRV